MPRAFDPLLAYHAKARVFRLVEFVSRPGVQRISRTSFGEECGILWIIYAFRLFEGVQVIKQAGVLIKTVHRRQILVAVTEVILAELSGRVSMRFQ